MKTVGEVMLKNVPILSPDEPLKKVAKIMKENRICGLPVVGKGRIEGIITDGDILNAFYLNVSSFSYEEKPGGEKEKFSKRIREFHEMKVKDVMTMQPRTVHESVGVDEAATQLKRFKIKRLIVVDDDGKPIGLVERLNIVDSILSE